MSSKEVFVSASGVRLLSNLEWRLLDANTSVDAALRSSASERGATHVVTAQATQPEEITTGKKTRTVKRIMGGFYVSPIEEGPGKKAYSLAAAFAVWSREHQRAILTHKLPSGEAVVVVVMNGLPSFDKVLSSADEAFNTVAVYLKDHSDISVFSDDVVLYPSSIHFDDSLFESIALCCDKTTLIRPLPVDVVKLSIVLILVLAVAGGYYFYDRHKKAEVKRLARLKAEEEDPIPKYLAALATQRNTLGIDRASLSKAFQSAGKIPSIVNGWSLKKVTCSMTDGCSAVFVRGLGNFTGLKASLPYLTLNQPGSLDANTANMVWKQELVPASIDGEAISLDTFIQGVSGSLMQDWSVAGLTLQVQPPALWPQVPGVPPSIKLPQAIAVGNFGVTGLSMPLALEAINSAPKNVYWKAWEIAVEDAKADPLSRAKVSLIGSYYVKN